MCGFTPPDEWPPGPCPAQMWRPCPPEHDRGSATRGPARSVQAKEIKDDDPQAELPPSLALWARDCSRPPNQRQVRVLLHAPPSPPPAHLGCPAVGDPVLRRPLLHRIVGSVGQGSFLCAWGSAEQGAHPQPQPHPVGTQECPRPAFPGLPLSVNFNQTRAGVKAQEGKNEVEGCDLQNTGKQAYGGGEASSWRRVYLRQRLWKGGPGESPAPVRCFLTTQP